MGLTLLLPQKTSRGCVHVARHEDSALSDPPEIFWNHFAGHRFEGETVNVAVCVRLYSGTLLL